MDLKEQKYVCALAEYGNLTRAAEKLYISQPALSIYITNLEKNMGIQLFDRNGKKFALTYAGERYVECAKQMIELERKFDEELMDILREKAGRIRLGVSLRRGPWLIPPVIAEYEKIWPKVEIVIREGNLTELNEMLKNNELDMIVLNHADVTGNAETVSLFEEEFLLAVPVVHPLNERAEYVPGERYRKIRPEWLDGQALILHTPWQSSRIIENDILRKHKITPSRVRVVRGMELTMQMVAEGLGVGFVREGYAVNMRYTKLVNYYILDTERHKKEVVAAYKKGAPLPEYMRDMLELLKKQGERIRDR